jgi:Domain of unknown function (DUF1841)
MFNPSRDQARQFFFEAWQKRRDSMPLSPLEAIAADIIAKHAEYHTILESREQYAGRDFLPEQGETNPFLHLSMHITIAEQVSIDQPAGIRNAVQQLTQHLGSLHDAEHEVMDCLAETIWQAQRGHTAPDMRIYLDCLEQKLGAKK